MQCYRQHNVHQGISRCFLVITFKLSLSLLSSVKIRGAIGKPANSGVLWRMPIELYGAWLWAQVPLKDVGPWCHLHGIGFWQFGQKHAHSFCRALALLLLFLLTEKSSCPVQLSLCNGRCSWDCARRHNLTGLQVPPHTTSSGRDTSRT